MSSDSESEAFCVMRRSVARKRVIVSDEESSASEENEENICLRKRGRRNPGTYFQNYNKAQRNSGKLYVTAKSKIILAKRIMFRHCCSKKCSEKLSFYSRSHIFKAFWKLGNYNQQNVFLNSSVKRVAIKRRRPRKNYGKKRQLRFQYFLNHDNVSIIVCKNFFIDTLNVSKGRLNRALKRDDFGVDLRGKSKNSRRKTNDCLLVAVKEHIQSFPSYSSHYTRAQNPYTKYLSPDLNIRKMYGLYLEKCKSDNQEFVQESIYRKVFKSSFNLQFRQRRKDTCKKCDYYKIKSDACNDEHEKLQLQEDHDNHLRSAEKARQCLKNDQKNAADNPDQYFAFSFDFQKALPFPKLTVSVSYYKRNMYVLNLGIHNFHNNNINMYVWDETIASRGAQEVASCCLKHLKSVTTQKHVIAYSDACTGQNRNVKLALSWMKTVQSSENEIEIVDHKFLVSGHSYLPNDRDFGVIEMAVRKREIIYTPNDYYQTMGSSSKNAFGVIGMKTEDFFSTQSLEESITKRTLNTEQQKVNWLEIQWIRFRRDMPYRMLYKLTLEENTEFKILDLTPKSGRPRNISQIYMGPLYTTARPITDAKFKDMMDLILYIPPIYHNFFKELNTDSSSYELISPISDEEDGDEN